MISVRGGESGTEYSFCFVEKLNEILQPNWLAGFVHRRLENSLLFYRGFARSKSAD